MEKQAASLANYSFGERAIHEHTMASRVTQKMQSTYHGTRGALTRSINIIVISTIMATSL
ncbi:Zinc knuckle family protein [Aspergillus niger]|uniref:Zinc knuckle family protein n=1 Tax=Aspergillus niger TaxID=5061 RepID=A0A505I8H2_ASPNG|nr:Zinc knuckle family protein [Aspergillus niger]